MREKFQAALRKMKKEQIVVWLLLLALAAGTLTGLTLNLLMPALNRLNV